MIMVYKEDLFSGPFQKDVEGSLDSLHVYIPGFIQAMHIGNGVLMLFDDDGKLKGLRKTIWDPDLGEIVGPVLWCSENESGEAFAGLSLEQIQWLWERYNWGGR